MPSQGFTPGSAKLNRALAHCPDLDETRSCRDSDGDCDSAPLANIRDEKC